MRYLIVGFGNIGKKRAGVLGKKLAASVDPNPKTGAGYKNVKDVPLAIFDVAVLTIPQQNKTELAEFFLSKGKHVLVEKPLIITPSQAKLFNRLSKKNKVIWFTSFNHRFEPNIEKLSGLLKKKTIGKFYWAKFTYSFGNIKERLGTWRETEYGVLEEIAPHLIDFAFNFFGYKGKDFKTLISRKVESNIFDHWVFATKDDKILFETSSVSWKYHFKLDIYGSKGSLHIDGLRKWGGNKLILMKRILPSGAPKEKVILDSGPDITWEEDFKVFESLVKQNKNSANSDSEMSLALANIALGAKLQKKDQQTKIYEQIISES